MTDVTVLHVQYPEDCCPTGWHWKYACWESALTTVAGQKWWTLRCFVNKLVDHKWFETFIIVMIVASSVSLVSLFIIYSSFYLHRSVASYIYFKVVLYSSVN